MSFPNIIYGKFGDEKVVSSSKSDAVLGQRMVLPDGSSYAYARCSSTAAIGVALVCTQKDVQWAETACVATAGSGSTGVTVTLGATAAVTKDQFEDGSVWCYKSTGVGWKYRIKSNNSAAAAETCTMTLYPGDEVKVAWAAATVLLRENPFKSVLVSAAATAQVGIVAGVTAASCAVSQYIWLARRGEVPIVCSDTVGVVGARATLSASTAGNCQRWIAAADTTTNSDVIGTFTSVAATKADAPLVYLLLD